MLVLAVMFAACGDGNAADERGIGAQCATTDDCNTDLQQVCLMQFKGGYCGEMGCTADADCVEDSACIRQDGVNYCFRTCVDKAQCNANRAPANEANCSSSVDFVEGAMGRKACVPPSR